MIPYADFPFLRGGEPLRPLHELAVGVVHERLRTPETVDAGVDRMAHELVQQGGLRELPDQLVASSGPANWKQRQRVAISQRELPNARLVPQLRKQ